MRPPRADLERLYLTDRLTTRAVGRHFGVSKTEVRRWLIYYDIPRRQANCGLLNRGVEPPSREQIFELVHGQHLSYAAIGARYGINKTSVMAWLRKHGIRRPRGWETRRNGRALMVPAESALRALYEAGFSADVIARERGVSDTTVFRWLRQYGIARRPGGFKSGLRFPCIDGHAGRSVYEQRVDDWLHLHSIPHEPEPAIPGGGRLRGDFVANGWYIEIWGVHSRPDYHERKHRKRVLYAIHGLALIEFAPDDFATSAHWRWERKLRRCLCPPTATPAQLALLLAT